jgi:hypothetical protein
VSLPLGDHEAPKGTLTALGLQGSTDNEAAHEAIVLSERDEDLKVPEPHAHPAVDPIMLTRIMEMGFEEHDAASALIECGGDSMRASNVLAVRASNTDEGHDKGRDHGA